MRLGKLIDDIYNGLDSKCSGNNLIYKMMLSGNIGVRITEVLNFIQHPGLKN
jgi:hypothetical protein